MQYPDADVLAFSLAKLSAYWRAELGSDDEDFERRHERALRRNIRYPPH